ncbi:RND superfamily putative drug exporter [Paenibacillus amylolyticus]|uniref:RND superfamily putative drug exporter n=1 Tax=Paenibacillus amylolyticus TaxID=1451 RepID=A0AAP5H144_PAEAM|nr:MMPL family transporter [Paenibacillus amylolyticus]MDR6723056.1 RND superfamily putative drug exporter [Paenibacillus amylolyticus]
MQEGSGYGRWVAGKRSKWVTLLVWIIIAVVLGLVWPAVNDRETNNAQDLSDSKPSVQAAVVAQREFPGGEGLPALIVWHQAGGLTDEHIKQIQALTERLDQDPVEEQQAVVPLYQLPPQAIQGQLSEDGSTLVMPLFFNEGADAEQLEKGIDALKEKTTEIFGVNPFEVAVDDTSSLSARVTGPVGISIDASGLFSSADVSLLIATVILVLVLLLLIYRSPVLAIIPIIAVGFAYMVTSPILGFMADQGWITVDAQSISIMTVLLFGAGTDYCLFMISRFRQILYHEPDKKKALFQAITGSSGAIAMSGFTVVAALLVLLLAEYGAYHRFAVPFSLSIFIMFIASLTLVPALLAIFGRGSFYPFVPRTHEMEVERAKKKGKPAPAPRKVKESWIGRTVVTKPWTVLAVTLVLLGGLAVFSTQIKFTYDLLSSFPEDVPSREGFTVIGEQFSQGELAPVKVIIDAEGQETDLQSKLEALDYVSKVGDAQQGAENANITGYDVEFNLNPYSMEAMQHIPDLRATAEQALTAAGISNADTHVWIDGQTAEQYDIEVTGERDAKIIIPVVIGMITLLLLLYLRSVVATAYLIATVVLSFFSALGLGWLIIHYGLGADAIQGAIPLYSFVFLVALGEDYNIFMISSIWQKRKTMPLRQAIKEGVGETGSVITSAGLILAGTFAVLATLPIQVLVQFGIITAVGVMLDTFLVRPFMVPAITTLLGKWAFWPGKYVPIAEKQEEKQV